MRMRSCVHPEGGFFHEPQNTAGRGRPVSARGADRAAAARAVCRHRRRLRPRCPGRDRPGHLRAGDPGRGPARRRRRLAVPRVALGGPPAADPVPDGLRRGAADRPRTGRGRERLRDQALPAAGAAQPHPRAAAPQRPGRHPSARACDRPGAHDGEEGRCAAVPDAHRVQDPGRSGAQQRADSAAQLLLERIWDEGGQFIDDNTLSVHVSRLREKIGPEHIRTVRGVGYQWEDSV